jgi:hypothetical protein
MPSTKYGVAKTTTSLTRKYAKDNLKNAMDQSISDIEFEKALKVLEKSLRSYRDAARSSHV